MPFGVVKSNKPYGLYVWRLSNGRIFSDGNGNIMNIPGVPFDIEAMNSIREAAKYYGVSDGNVEYMSGVTRVSESRASEERARMAEGLIPSETDVGAWEDAEHGFMRAMSRGEDYDAYE